MALLSRTLDVWQTRWPLIGYLREYGFAKGRFTLAAVLALVKHTPVLFIPIYTGYVIDVIIPAADTVGLALALVGMAALIMINMALHPISIRVASKVRREVSLRLRARLCQRIQQLSFTWHDRQCSGRLHSKVMQDVEKLDRVGQLIIDPLFILAVTTVAALGIMAIKQPLFGLPILCLLPIIMMQQRIFRARLEQEHHRLRLEHERLNADIEEMLAMLPVTRAHATEHQDLSKVADRLHAVRDRGVGTDWVVHLLHAQMWGTGQLVVVGVTCFGGLLVIKGMMSIGELVMFLTFMGLVIGGLSGILAQIVSFYEGNEAMRSINETLQVPELEHNEGKGELPPLEGAVAFRNVWFTYPGGDKPVLKQLNLEVRPRETIALVGGSGAGKTTFIKLLLGFYRPIEGEIFLDGYPMSAIDLRSFRRQIGIVTQDTFLFNGTIFQNLAHGRTEVSREEIEEAARQANAHDFIMELPDRYETEIGDRGALLSGGQKQRLAIARALLRQPRILILDEATSALDSKSERLVQEALEHLMAERTCFVIAHRLSTIRNADRILVFDRGEIVEEGPHTELVQREGVYAKLVELQGLAG